MTTLAASGRFSTVVRWLGLTLVVLLLLQLTATLIPWAWGEEAFRQLLVERLVSQAPLALLGLLLVLLSSRLDHPNERHTPVRWLVTGISAVLAVALLVAVPVSISGDRALADQAEQQLASQRSQVQAARAQLQNPLAIQQLVAQLEQTGQLPPGGTAEQKLQLVKTQFESRLQQAEKQIQQAERARDLSTNQRRYGGTGSALVLAVAFTLLALASAL
ncbi:HpsJ family protein [Cyanobium sp. Morenito 9A2]|uniref:HpsJ family protein n=1 Tax=Cyanobium sp. Morenito 9A2 TaxID=2823718 RepID=UPI0020CEF6ED|nr:HpsJ family protein [Cyanobium sp. Morenito 9A2]